MNYHNFKNDNNNHKLFISYYHKDDKIKYYVYQPKEVINMSQKITKNHEVVTTEQEKKRVIFGILFLVNG